MPLSSSRLVALICLGLIIFALAAFLLLRIMPTPMRPFDYLITGAVSTLISLLVIWILLMRDLGSAKELLFKRRARLSSPPTSPGPSNEDSGQTH